MDTHDLCDAAARDLRHAFTTQLPSAAAEAELSRWKRAEAKRLAEATPQESPLLTIEEAADYLNKKPSWVRHTLRFEIPVVKLGQAIRFERRELDAYIANCREVPAR